MGWEIFIRAGQLLPQIVLTVRNLGPSLQAPLDTAVADDYYENVPLKGWGVYIRAFIASWFTISVVNGAAFEAFMYWGTANNVGSFLYTILPAISGGSAAVVSTAAWLGYIGLGASFAAFAAPSLVVGYYFVGAQVDQAKLAKLKITAHGGY